LQRKGPLYILPWRCTFACNYNCVHCTSAGKPAAQDEINTEDAKRIIDQAYEFGASFFGITGGEALLRKDLFKVIAYAREVGLNTSIITDGRLLDDKAFESIVKNKVKVSVSIDGCEATNDLVRGKGAYAAAVKSIERLSREKLLNCLVYTLANVNEKGTNVTETKRKKGKRAAKKPFISRCRHFDWGSNKFPVMAAVSFTLNKASFGTHANF
jgi:MoaA/NifB/PqqE/SkfB family radical SAM enzyme